MAAGLTLPRGRSLAFIGFMGAGKTTAAQSAAGVLATDALDVDRVIEQRLGKTIERVFAVGWNPHPGWLKPPTPESEKPKAEEQQEGEQKA